MGIQLREIGAWARERKFIATLLVAATLAIGILIGTVISGRVNATHAILPSGATLLDLPNPVSLSNAFGAIVERDEPAVVNISTTQVIDRKGQSQNRGGGSLDPFHDFFNRFFDAPDEGPEAERSLGSGIIVDKKGFILTNNHVIEQATKIQVQLNTEPTLYTDDSPIPPPPRKRHDRKRKEHKPGQREKPLPGRDTRARLNRPPPGP